MLKAGAMKPGRVKVGVRCRPAFQDEIDFAKGEFLSIVDIKPEDKNQSSFGQISLTLISGKQREFSYDYAFHTNATQDYVYDRIARPVVTDVLKGFNGTIFAYGQTGTGKTYTMGILEFVSNEHAGIIPRAISQIFEHVEGQDSVEVSVSLSFLQLYRETIQDLLSPASANGSTPSGNDENLAIREDPQRGFFVEGLQEFTVRNYREAEALINLGLENRAIAPTLMNVTSSRSHTVLTLNIEQRITEDGSSSKSYSKTLRSKLLMVDLAGSERVRRTVSKGTRLSEAKSINTSLSALGNVIAALAEQNVTHVPYRDSKLTRLLQDSLGGTASTALIATVGPAAVNYGETLSTLLFASRCMAVKITPVQHEEVDYAEMCAQLQAQVNAMEGAVTARLEAQQQAHEKAIRELSQTFEMEKSLVVQQEFASAQQTTVAARAAFDTELNSILDRLERAASSNVNGSSTLSRWLGKPVGWKGNAQELSRPDARLVALLGYSFEIVSYLSNTMSDLMRQNLERDEQQHSSLLETFKAAGESETERLKEMAAMESNDPQVAAGAEEGECNVDGDRTAIGSHLAPLSRLEAMTRVEGKFRSNNAPTSPFDRLVDASAAVKVSPRPAIYNYKDADEIAVALASMHSSIRQNASSLSALLVRKDSHYQVVKGELTEQMVEKRKREEEVINWSYILKYLLASSSKLRKQLQREKKVQAALSHLQTTAVPSAVNSAPDTQRNVSESSVSNLFGQATRPGRYGPTESSSASDVDSDGEEGGEARSTTSVDMSERFSEVTGATGLTTNMAPFGGFRDTNEAPLPPLPRSNKNSVLPLVTPSSTFRAGQASSVTMDTMSEVSMSPLDAARFRREMQNSDQRFHDQPPHTQHLHQQQQLQQTRQPRTNGAASDSLLGLRVPEAVGSADEDTVGLSDEELSVDMRSSASSITRSMAGNSLHSQQPPRSIIPAPLTNSISVAHLQPRNPRTENSVKKQQQIPLRDRASSAPSAFAEEVVRSLGVEEQQAAAAMSIVDQVSRITPEQLRLLDPETRAQILQIRKDLKLDPAPLGGNRFPDPSPSVRGDNLSPNRKRSLSTPRTRLSASSASTLSQYAPQTGPRSISRSRSNSNGRGDLSVSSSQDRDMKQSQPSQHAMPPYLATRAVSPSAGSHKSSRAQQPQMKLQQQQTSHSSLESHRQQLQEPQFSRVNTPDSRRGDRRAFQQQHQQHSQFDDQQSQRSQFHQQASVHVPYKESSNDIPQPRQPPRQYPQPQVPPQSVYTTPSFQIAALGSQPQTRIRSSSGDRGRGANSNLSYGNDSQHDYRPTQSVHQRATPAGATQLNFQTPQYSQYQPASQQQFSQSYQQQSRNPPYRGQHQQQFHYSGEGNSDDEFSQLDYLDV